MTIYYNKRNRNPDNNNSIIISEMTACDTTSLPQEFDASGIPSLRPYLSYLLENGAAEYVKVKWGKSERYVIMIGGEKYQYKGGHNINKIHGKNILRI